MHYLYALEMSCPLLGSVPFRKIYVMYEIKNNNCFDHNKAQYAEILTYSLTAANPSQHRTYNCLMVVLDPFI